ncbi:MAG: exodeoxyribonuclease VII large subunit [Bacteroides sp.]
MSNTALSLLDLNALVRQGIEACLPDSYWVQAELSDVRSNASGHCYLEFIQKDEHSGAMLAKARGIIWSSMFNLLKPYFEESTGETFRSGLKVLVEVNVSFHELYGYSLTVQNIDPTYTLGDMVKRKAEIIKQLEKEGVLTLNKELELPLLTQRIAVISSATAAGYEDFCEQLLNNSWGIPFYAELFPALMQGEQVEPTVLAALDQILDREDEFDVVVIIRGGGASSDLSGFDTYLLAAACAQFPMPIITGIGHERDDTVLDVVAHTRVKTPTAAAEFLVGRMVDLIASLENLKNRLQQAVQTSLKRESDYLMQLQKQIPQLALFALNSEDYKLKSLQRQLISATNHYLKEQTHRLNTLSLELKGVSPFEVMKKGYALVFQQGRAISSVKDVKLDSSLTIMLKDGSLSTVVQKKDTND